MQHLGRGFPEKTVADNAEAQISTAIALAQLNQ